MTKSEEIIFNEAVELGKKMAHKERCLFVGCQYGFEGIDKAPKDECIWCGTPRKEPWKQK